MRSRLLWIVAVAALAGCRTVPVHPPPATQSWEARRPELQARDRFGLKGRVAVATGKDGFNAGLRWTQEGALSHVALEGPFGAGGVQITAEGPTLSVVTSHGEHLDSDAARAELGSRLGFEPPLSSLRYWILGVPDPAQPAQEAVDQQQQRLQSLQQNGWQIDYSGYMPVGSEWLPARMTLQRAGVRVRVVVDGWNS
ncbi:MAG: outer rane lipoprotein LolB [Gammaproteobacteria bacterium]|jgi:outer membrane lipoprotein LolB|nr:outer rane lipoprotein LolB [Gammaproteobacteria bacterium]